MQLYLKERAKIDGAVVGWNLIFTWALLLGKSGENGMGDVASKGRWGESQENNETWEMCIIGECFEKGKNSEKKWSLYEEKVTR